MSSMRVVDLFVAQQSLPGPQVFDQREAVDRSTASKVVSSFGREVTI